MKVTSTTVSFRGIYTSKEDNLKQNFKVPENSKKTGYNFIDF